MPETVPLHCRLSANGAFSLIELLVVVAIMAILTTLYWHQGPSKRDREFASCRQNLEKIYLAMGIYTQDNAGKFPMSANARTAEDPLALLVPHYSSDTEIFICPASGNSLQPAGKSFRDWKISYAYYMGRVSADTDKALMSDEQVNSSSKAMGTTVFSSTGKAPGNNHGKTGGNFLMGDGGVVSSTGDAPVPLTLTPPVVLLNPKP